MRGGPALRLDRQKGLHFIDVPGKCSLLSVQEKFENPDTSSTFFEAPPNIHRKTNGKLPAASSHVLCFGWITTASPSGVLELRPAFGRCFGAIDTRKSVRSRARLDWSARMASFTCPLRFAFVGLILLTSGESAFGGNYTDQSGFSFDYPDGWVPVTRASMEDVKHVLPDKLKSWISKNNVNLNQAAVVLLRDGRDEFLENLNVVVVEGQQLPVDDQTVKKLTEELPQRYGTMNLKVANVQGRVQKVGLNDAVVMEYLMGMPGMPYILRQRQVMFTKGGKTYIVTCTAKADSFDKYQPTFEKIVSSFQLRTTVANAKGLEKGFDWNQVTSSAVKWGIIGGVVGGLAGLLRWIANKSSSKSNLEPGSSRPPYTGYN
jgi:hypothetical protein